MNLKQLAAEHALQRVRSGMKLGLGTGSTVQYLLEGLAAHLRSGSLHALVGVPTSEATTHQAQQLGIPLGTLEQYPQLDMTIDGADEVAPDLSLIKGLGGALLREKIVAAASAQFVVVADASKRVERLGSRAPLPVEVVPFGWSTHLPLLQRLGATPQVRQGAESTPIITDNGNIIIDCHFAEGIPDPPALARALEAQPGVVGHGLFLAMATTVLIGTPDGVVTLERS
jgi:ribose 5-phosphate isomerase A